MHTNRNTNRNQSNSRYFGRIRRRSCAGAVALGLAMTLAAAANAQQRLPETIVTAARVATPLEQTAASVTVITAQDIEAQGDRTIVEVLRRVPGLNVVQSGGPGTLTSVFTRGGNSNHTLILIDGIEVADPIEIIPIQLLAYYSAIEKETDPDYPRNLAKSVTVK